jgi:hypothetical protein
MAQNGIQFANQSSSRKCNPIVRLGFLPGERGLCRFVDQSIESHASANGIEIRDLLAFASRKSSSNVEKLEDFERKQHLSLRSDS